MTITASKPCPICKKNITSTGGGNVGKHVQKKLNQHVEIHRPKPKPTAKAG